VKNILDTVLLYIKKAEIVLIVLMATLIVSVIAAQVFMRYFLDRPFTWVEELATLTLIYLCFFAADVVYKEKLHISVDYFVKKLPYKVQRIINLLINSSIVLFFFIIIPKTYQLVIMQLNIINSAAIVVPKSVYTLPVLIIFPSMLLTTINELIKEINSLISIQNNRPPDDSANKV
jgi:TRAP-type C4-dicarboxylate transport system permease small subunit